MVQQGKIKLTGTFALTHTWDLGSKPLSPSQTAAALSLRSDPSGATVYINDIRIGRTPLLEYELGPRGNSEGQVTVRLEHDGYNSEELILRPGAEIGGLNALQPTHIVGKDGAKMVLIPAGEFQMGSNDSDAGDDEKPVHTVYVDAFYMDIYEVTNAQYKKFVDANPQWGKDRIDSRYHNGHYLSYWNGNSYPSGEGAYAVEFVTWYAAMAYADWTGKRLPTEAEWEKAARGGLVGKQYPWGDSIDSSQASYGVNDRTPVGRYPPNGYGLYDMAGGNVSEWCLDEYQSDFYTRSPRANPIAGGTITSIINNFTSGGSDRVLRGGSRVSNSFSVRVATRHGFTPTGAFYDVGFRCARSQ